MSARKQSLERLSEIISRYVQGGNGMLYRNSFASACYFSRIGEQDASQKLLLSLFDQLGWDRRKKYFIAILETIHEFAFQYAREISANCELHRLFPRQVMGIQ